MREGLRPEIEPEPRTFPPLSRGQELQRRIGERAGSWSLSRFARQDAAPGWKSSESLPSSPVKGRLAQARSSMARAARVALALAVARAFSAGVRPGAFLGFMPKSASVSTGACAPSLEETSCWYPQGVCRCGVLGGPPDAGKLGWYCAGTLPGCPYPTPATGTECTQPGLSCGYSCDDSIEGVECDDGTWQFRYGCPS